MCFRQLLKQHFICREGSFGDNLLFFLLNILAIVGDNIRLLGKKVHFFRHRCNLRVQKNKFRLCRGLFWLVKFVFKKWRSFCHFPFSNDFFLGLLAEFSKKFFETAIQVSRRLLENNCFRRDFSFKEFSPDIVGTFLGVRGYCFNQGFQYCISFVKTNVLSKQTLFKRSCLSSFLVIAWFFSRLAAKLIFLTEVWRKLSACR